MVILGQRLAQLEIQCQPHDLLFLSRSSCSSHFECLSLVGGRLAEGPNIFTSNQLFSGGFGDSHTASNANNPPQEASKIICSLFLETPWPR